MTSTVSELSEPLLHSHVTDILPDEHLSAYTIVLCGRCAVMVHSSNNECMQTWVETGKGNYCLPCFVLITDGSVDDDYGIRRQT